MRLVGTNPGDMKLAHVVYPSVRINGCFDLWCCGEFGLILKLWEIYEGSV